MSEKLTSKQVTKNHTSTSALKRSVMHYCGGFEQDACLYFGLTGVHPKKIFSPAYGLYDIVARNRIIVHLYVNPAGESEQRRDIVVVAHPRSLIPPGLSDFPIICQHLSRTRL